MAMPFERSHSQAPGVFSDGVVASQPSYTVAEGGYPLGYQWSYFRTP